MLQHTQIPHPLRSWNRKVLDETAALAFCKEHSVYIVTDDRQQYGRYIPYKGYAFILINPALEPGMRLWVLLHEIGHFLFHHPTNDVFSLNVRSKRDREANYFAAIAMMPAPLLKGMTIDEVAKRFDYPRKIVEIRYEIYEREGI